MPRLQIDCESERVSLLHPDYSTEGGARARSVGIDRNFITVQQRCTGFFFGKRVVRVGGYCGLLGCLRMATS